MTISRTPVSHDVPTSTLSAADAGRFVREVNGEAIVSGTIGGRGIGVCAGVYSVGGNSFAVVQDAGEAVVLAAAVPFAVGDRITNDGTGAAIVAGPGQQVLGVVKVVRPGSLVVDLLGFAVPSTSVAITPYVVGPPSSGAPFAQIQPAIDACFAAGGDAVYIHAGTYVEDLTLRDGVALCAIPVGLGIVQTATVIVSGAATWAPAGGVLSLEGILFQAAAPGTRALTITGASKGNLITGLCGFVGNAESGVRINGTSPALICIFRDGSIAVGTGSAPAGVGALHYGVGAQPFVVLDRVGLDAFSSLTDESLHTDASPSSTIYRHNSVTGNFALNAGVVQLVDASIEVGSGSCIIATNNALVQLERVRLSQNGAVSPTIDGAGPSTVFMLDVTTDEGLTLGPNVSTLTRSAEDAPQISPWVGPVASALANNQRTNTMDTTAGAVTLTLPDGTTQKSGTPFEFKWTAGAGAATVVPFGAQSIEGVAAPFVLGVVLASLRLRWDATTLTWWSF